jgi:hypothetical protein
MAGPATGFGIQAASLTQQTRARVSRALLIGISMASLSVALSHSRSKPSDFAQIWYAAGAWVQGLDPYSVIGPGRAFEWPFPLLYPMPAVLAAVPLAGLPLRLADALVAGLGGCLFALAVTRERLNDPRLFMCVSAAGLLAVQTSQWSPLLCAAALIPALGPLLACKPTLGLALLAAYPSARALMGMVALTLVSLAAMTSWPWQWLEALPSATHMSAPLGRPGGFLVLAVLIQWRLPEARLLAAWSMMPQTPVLYEAVPLFLIPKTWKEASVLAALTYACALTVHAGAPYPSYDEWMKAGGTAMLWWLYIPCVGMVLSRSLHKDRIWTPMRRQFRAWHNQSGSN